MMLLEEMLSCLRDEVREWCILRFEEDLQRDTYRNSSWLPYQ